MPGSRAGTQHLDVESAVERDQDTLSIRAMELRVSCNWGEWVLDHKAISVRDTPT